MRRFPQERSVVHMAFTRNPPQFPSSNPQHGPDKVRPVMVQAIEEARRRGGRTSVSSGPRVPPHNLDAERSLLGAMLLSRDAIAVAMETCQPDDFYKPTHGHIFDAVQTLYGRAEPADAITVADELSRAGLLEAVGG